jgi:dihydroorotase
MTAATREILIRGGRVIDPGSGLDEVADVLMSDGAVKAVGKNITAPDGADTIDAKGLVVAPGFVDLHCHLREPGFEDKETIASGTKAAAAGGFTTVCAMPNTDPPMDNASTIDYVMRKADAEGAVRVLPIGCVTKGSAGRELAEMAEMADAGAIGFSDDGHPVADDALMRQALTYASAFGLPIIEHCEVPELAMGGQINEGWVATRLGVKGVPAAAEEQMAARDIALAGLTGAWVHLAHASTAGTVDLVRRAKERGIKVTAEVTPHHLTLTEDAVLGFSFGSTGGGTGGGSQYDPLTPDAYNTFAKVNPPLRSQADVEAMIAALADGVIDVIATDHAPHNRQDKLSTLNDAAFGISNLETALAAVLALVHADALPLARLIESLTLGPAKLLGDRAPAGLGTLTKGAPGDVVLIDLDAEWVVEPEQFVSKGKNTPLAGATLRGRVVKTVFGGRVVYGPEQGKTS